MTPIRTALLPLVALALLVGACSGSDSGGDAADADADGATSTSVADTEQTATTEVAESPPADPMPPAFDTLVVEPTAPGPRPLLAWASVDGAAEYDLIVLDSQGVAYWAWSGDATEVYLGGVENPDAVGAWVFEPLTWIVTARDANGMPLAMSETQALLP